MSYSGVLRAGKGGSNCLGKQERLAISSALALADEGDYSRLCPFLYEETAETHGAAIPAVMNTHRDYD